MLRCVPRPVSAVPRARLLRRWRRRSHAAGGVSRRPLELRRWRNGLYRSRRRFSSVRAGLVVARPRPSQ